MEGFDTSTMKTWKSRSHGSHAETVVPNLGFASLVLGENNYCNFLPNGDMKNGDESISWDRIL